MAAEIVSLLDTPDGPSPAPRPGPAPAPAPAPGLLQLQVEAPHAPQTPHTLRAAQGVAVKLNKEGLLVRNNLSATLPINVDLERLYSVSVYL